MDKAPTIRTNTTRKNSTENSFGSKSSTSRTLLKGELFLHKERPKRENNDSDFNKDTEGVEKRQNAQKHTETWAKTKKYIVGYMSKCFQKDKYYSKGQEYKLEVDLLNNCGESDVVKNLKHLLHKDGGIFDFFKPERKEPAKAEEKRRQANKIQFLLDIAYCDDEHEKGAVSKLKDIINKNLKNKVYSQAIEMLETILVPADMEDFISTCLDNRKFYLRNSAEGAKIMIDRLDTFNTVDKLFKWLESEYEKCRRIKGPTTITACSTLELILHYLSNISEEEVETYHKLNVIYAAHYRFDKINSLRKRISLAASGSEIMSIKEELKKLGEEKLHNGMTLEDTTDRFAINEAKNENLKSLYNQIEDSNIFTSKIKDILEERENHFEISSFLDKKLKEILKLLNNNRDTPKEIYLSGWPLNSEIDMFLKDKELAKLGQESKNKINEIKEMKELLVFILEINKINGGFYNSKDDPESLKSNIKEMSNKLEPKSFEVEDRGEFSDLSNRARSRVQQTKVFIAALRTQAKENYKEFLSKR
jgi:hypothetical protein